MWAVIVAAGWGERFGGPKQFSDLGGARLVDHAVATASAVCDAVVLVVPDATDWQGADGRRARHRRRDAEPSRCAPAWRRCPHDAEVVVVHDAARPLATEDLFVSVIAAVHAGADGAVPGLAVADTLKRVDDVRRDRHRRPRRPRRGADAAGVPRPTCCGPPTRRGRDATDDAALVEAIGGNVVVVPGDPRQPQDHRPRRPHDRGRAARGAS